MPPTFQSFLNARDVLFARALEFLREVLFFASFGATIGRSRVDVTLFDDDLRAKNIVEEVTNCIEAAQSSRLYPAPRPLRFVPGMSGQGFRRVLNDLMKTRHHYLEIGTWKGSTAVSAIKGNTLAATLVDNWSEFGGPVSQAIKNVGRATSKSTRVSIWHEDFMKADFSRLDSTDFYFFDGPHSENDHIQGVQVISQLSFGSLIFAVDDWDWAKVKKGTFEGIGQLSNQPSALIEIEPSKVGHWRSSRWHNGYAFFVFVAKPEGH